MFALSDHRAVESILNFDKLKETHPVGNSMAISSKTQLLQKTLVRCWKHSTINTKSASPIQDGKSQKIKIKVHLINCVTKKKKRKIKRGTQLVARKSELKKTVGKANRKRRSRKIIGETKSGT